MAWSRPPVPESHHAITKEHSDSNLFTMFRMAVELHVNAGATMITTSSGKHTWAVVLAGGDGVRLKEMTHQIAGDSRPKQFCSFFEGKSLLHHTQVTSGRYSD
jgi:hypothetical protein